MRAPSGQSEQELALRRQIDQTRRQLGQTVEALINKADVEKRVETKVHQAAGALQARGDQVKERVTELGHKTQEVAPERLLDVVNRAAHSLAGRPALTVGMVAAVVWVALGRTRRS